MSLQTPIYIEDAPDKLFLLANTQSTGWRIPSGVVCG